MYTVNTCAQQDVVNKGDGTRGTFVAYPLLKAVFETWSQRFEELIWLIQDLNQNWCSTEY